jgi:hypothetical protein
MQTRASVSRVAYTVSFADLPFSPKELAPMDTLEESQPIRAAYDPSKWPDCDIDYLIIDAGDFVVFIDHELDLDWKTTAKYDKIGPTDAAKHNEMLNYVAALECIPNNHHDRSVRLNFKRMIGEGVARSLDHDYAAASTMLDRAAAYINNRNVETARCWQLSTACRIGVGLVLCGIVFWTFRAFLIAALGEPGFLLLGAGGAGCLGALLSMILRMGNSYPSSEASKNLHILEASSRIFAGGISGILMAGAVNTGLILPALSNKGQMHGALLVFGMVSGASERLVPSLIGRLESGVEEARLKKGKAK